MTLLALLLIGLGTADLARRPPDPGRGGDRSVAAAAIVTAVAGMALGAGWHTTCITLVVAAIASLWLTGQRDGVEPRWSVGVVAAAILAAIGAGPYLDLHRAPIADWYADLDIPRLADVPLDRFALGLGVLLVLQRTANVVVRLVLDRAGPEVLAVEQTLQGGRLLGPLERTFVFALALAGQFALFAALVAAKGILRYPEISRDDPAGSRAEYVLLGSFVSWGIALLFVPLF